MKPAAPGGNAAPAVQPAQPGRAADGKIEIKATRADAARAQRRVLTTGQYWLNYYRTHDEKSSDLKEKVTLLNAAKKFPDVEAALRGYLASHSKDSEPWMYEALAIAMKANGGNEAHVKQAFGFAADLALGTQNPNDLVSVADLMLVHGYYDRVGSLLDLAAKKVPHHDFPPKMMIKLAQKTKDPQRMAVAVDALLSLGWPGVDEVIRREARAQAETLAKALREEQRSAEADTLMARLAESEARDLFVRLTWTGDAGLSLEVDEPHGATARDVTPRTVFGGSIVKGGYGKHPESVYVCPRGFDGDYTIRVETIYNNPKEPALEATLEIITHEGTAEEHKVTQTLKLDKPPAPVVVTLKGGRRKTVLPFLAPQRPPIAPAQAAAAPATTKDSGAAKESKPSKKAATPKPGTGTAPRDGTAVKARPR